MVPKIRKVDQMSIKEIGEEHSHQVDFFDSGIKIRNIQDSKIKATSEMSANYDHVFVVVGDNSLRYTWSRDYVDGKLKEIMSEIHSSCLEYGKEKNHIDYLKGANIAGFIKVADAMLAQGVV